MAITGLQIVTDAMYAAGILGTDESITDADSQLCLRRLNRLSDSWSNFRSLCYEVQTDSFTMTPSVASYSSTLLTVIGRPLNIDSGYVLLSNISWEVDFDMTAQEWAAITYKPVPSIPRRCYVDRSFPDATFNFYPVPYAAFTCFVSSTKSLPNTIALTTSVAMPPGYERFIVDSLAIDIFPSFRGADATVPETLVASAREAREAVKRTNLVVPIMDAPFDTQPDPSNGFIYKGF